MRNLRSLLPVLLLALLAGCSTTPSIPTPEGLTPSGTLTIREQQVLRITVGGSGEGTLIFQGWQYPFSAENMTVSGVGNNPVDLEGAVYNLEKLEDFEGSYKPMKAEIKTGEGRRITLSVLPIPSLLTVPGLEDGRRHPFSVVNENGKE